MIAVSLFLSLEKRYRNTIRVNPFSNCLLIGGFGNLAGEMDFWDLKNLKELGSTKSYCSVAVEWAADGKHLMTAVLFERVRVDNELKIFNAAAKQIIYKKYHDQELLDVLW